MDKKLRQDIFNKALKLYPEASSVVIKVEYIWLGLYPVVREVRKVWIVVPTDKKSSRTIIHTVANNGDIIG